MVDWRGCDEASGATLSSVLTFLRAAAALIAVLSFGSLGFRVFFSLGLPSSIGLPSTAVSFFLRCRLTLTGGVEVCGAVVFVCAPEARVFVRLEGSAELAAGAATPPTPTSACGRATRMVSDAKPTFCGDVGGEEMEDELCSEAASSIRILSPKPGGMAIAE
jgi:hypothetical protein